MTTPTCCGWCRRPPGMTRCDARRHARCPRGHRRLRARSRRGAQCRRHRRREAGQDRAERRPGAIHRSVRAVRPRRRHADGRRIPAGRGLRRPGGKPRSRDRSPGRCPTIRPSCSQPSRGADHAGDGRVADPGQRRSRSGRRRGGDARARGRGPRRADRIGDSAVWAAPGHIEWMRGVLEAAADTRRLEPVV